MKSSVGRNWLSKKSCQESGRGECACALGQDFFGKHTLAPVAFIDILAVSRFIIQAFKRQASSQRQSFPMVQQPYRPLCVRSAPSFPACQRPHEHFCSHGEVASIAHVCSLGSRDIRILTISSVAESIRQATFPNLQIVNILLRL